MAICDQLTCKGAWRNIFVTHNAFEIFSRYSHTIRGNGKPKMSYPTKNDALKAARGRHRTDIAIALYYVMHHSVPFEEVPEMRGHLNVEKKQFRCDDIAARLNSIIKAITPNELATLGLPLDYETEFQKRKNICLM